MAFFRKSERHGEGEHAGVRSLEEPMEATLADNGGLARLTLTLSGSREAGARFVVGTAEFAGFGVQVFLEDPLLGFDALRTFGQDIWQIANRQEGEAQGVFEPHLKLKVRAPSRRSSRLDVDVEFEMGTDAHVTARLQSDGTLALAFVEALERALEAIDEL